MGVATSRKVRYNRALLAKRQIGSTFKPFVYAAAFGHGMAPGTLVDDAPIREGDIAGLATTWSPENSDGQNQGLQPAALGLIRSRNTMTVRVGEFATRSVVRELALKAGLENVPGYSGNLSWGLRNNTQESHRRLYNVSKQWGQKAALHHRVH